MLRSYLGRFNYVLEGKGTDTFEDVSNCFYELELNIFQRMAGNGITQAGLLGLGRVPRKTSIPRWEDLS